jgi:Tol biopolymer transport system component
MYFGVAVAGHAHLWRQAYPDGAPEQITFGPTEEEGVAVAPDGRSLITSIGHRQSAIWIHDASGDRPLASESFAYAPRLSRDSRRVYFLQRESPDASTSELRRIDLASGKVERLLAGLPFALDDDVIGRDYDISRDERDVVFAARDRNGRPTIWLARLDGGVAPRAIVAGGHYVSFGERDEIFFVTLDKETSYLTRTDRDGVRRERIGSISPVFSRGGMSPDGEWIVVFGRSPDNVDGPATYAVPIRGGAPQRICTGMCWGGWSGDGRTFYVNVYDESTPEQTIAIPLPGGTTVPDVPPLGLNQSTNQLTIPGVRIINRWAVPLGDPSTYVYAKSELLRNLYRVPLH